MKRMNSSVAFRTQPSSSTTARRASNPAVRGQLLVSHVLKRTPQENAATIALPRTEHVIGEEMINLHFRYELTDRPS